MTDILQVQGVQDILSIIITIVIIPIAYKVFGYFLAKTENFYLIQLEMLIRDCVVEANQTIVDELKKTGEFTKEKQVEIFNAVFDKVMALFSDRGKIIISKFIEDFEAFVKAKIEAIVRDNKK